jgi:hypothetical protein
VLSMLLALCSVLQVGASSPLIQSALQSPTATAIRQGSMAGTVTDPSGAIVPDAAITLSAEGASSLSATSDSAGHYTFTTLQPGVYTLAVAFLGFAPKTISSVVIEPGQRKVLDVTLVIASQQQQVEISSNQSGTDPAQNGDAIVLNGGAIQALSSDTSQMLQQLQAMAGPSDSGTQLYVDGFSSGKMPPKSSIREIRLNDNPYSAEYDQPGFGRIEIFTKPGSDTLHGDLFVSGTDSAFDSRNPFAPQPQPFYSTQIQGDLTDKITKHSSFFLSGTSVNLQDSAIINAVSLDTSGNQTSITGVLPSPHRNFSVSLRFDAQLTPSNTFSLRYQIDRATQNNAGVGQLLLASQAYDSRLTIGTLQLSDTKTFGSKIVNELRFQYIRTRSAQSAASSSPALIVQGAFTGGGNNLGQLTDNQDQYELQNYTSIELGKHLLHFGVRQRLNRDSNYSTANYNGEYIFPTLTAYQLTVQGLQQGLTPAQIRAAGGGASQFNITSGNPSAAVFVSDTALFAEDTWKLRTNLTLAYGLRFETQNAIHDHADFAPRFSVNWGIHAPAKKPPLLVLRAGSGVFYQRFPSADLLQATRLDGIRQQQFVLTSPDTYPNIPSPSELNSQTAPTTFQISPYYRSPYNIKSTLTLEHNFNQFGVLTLGYTDIRGVHLLLTRNINAPLPGTYDPAVPTSGIRPLGGLQNVYRYDPVGESHGDFLYVTANIHKGSKFDLFANYVYGFRRTDTSGGFPSNQYDVQQDYGRDATDYRHRLFLGSFFNLPHGITGGPFLVVQSSSPFNITLGQDLNGDSQFNDRPTFATDLSRPSVIQTRYGNFDTAPIPGQHIIPINYGNGPGLFLLNLNLGKNFNFGPVIKAAEDAPAPPPGGKSPPIERRYTLTFFVEAQNIFNHVNPAPPVGTLGSPLFGVSNALNSSFSQGSANRTINLLMFLHF